MIDKHVVISSLLAGGRNWRTQYDILGPDNDAGLMEALNRLVASGTVETHMKHYPLQFGQINMYRLTSGSKYNMLVS